MVFGHQRRVAFIFAHPDDLVLSCGGTVAKLVHEGCIVNVLELTDGTQSNSQYSKERIRESNESARLIGYTVDRLAFEDGDVHYNHSVIGAIEDYLNIHKPEVVVTHFPQGMGRGHQDHQAVSSAVLNGARRCAFINYIFYSEPVTSFDDFTPNYFVDISDFFATKLESVQLHKSEAHKYYISENSIASRARFWRELAVPTRSSTDEYFEAFCLVKGVINR